MAAGRWRTALALVFWSTLVALIYGLYTGALKVPSRYDDYNPWAPLDVMALPNALTAYKLSRVQTDPAMCLATLAQTGMQYDTVPDRITGTGCGFENAVRLRAAGVRFGAPLTLSCPMAMSFFMWEHHALQPAASARFGQRVVAVDTLGSYACRNVNTGEGSASGNTSRSRHATANALDISGLTLEKGQRFSVLKHWSASTNDAALSPESLLLKDAHDGACRYFKGVLGPDYNAVHRDHFHLETGGYRMCR